MSVGFIIQRRMCETCIYRKDSPLDVHRLEAQVADPPIFRAGGFGLEAGGKSAVARQRNTFTA